MSAVAIGAALLLSASGQAEGQQPAPAPAPAPVQTTGADAPAPSADTAADPAPEARSEGVTPYPLSFFDSQRPGNAAEMLERLPGFVFDGGDDVRGFAGAAGNVLIDGERPSVKGDELYNLIRRIPASAVERIDVIRGGAPGIDMQGKPVVANIIRRAGGGNTGLIAFAFNIGSGGRFLPALRLEGQGRRGALSGEASILLFSGEGDYSGFGQETQRDGAGALRLTGPYEADTTYDGVELRGSGEWRRPRGEAFRVNANYQLVNEDQHERSDFVTSTGAPGGFDRSIYAFTRNRGQFGGTWTRPLASNLTGTLILLQTLQREQFDAFSDGQGDPSRFLQDETSGESIARPTVAWRRSETLSFELGGEVAYNFLDGETALTVAGAPVVLPSANVRVEEQRGEAFVTATWRPIASLSVEAGARVETSLISQSGDSDQERSFTFLKPRLNLAWTPMADTSVRLRLEREVGQLDFGDFVASASVSDDTVNAGNPDLEPERAWVAEVAFERRFWGRGAAILTLSHAEVQQVADLVPIDRRFDAPGNIGDGTRDLARINLTVPLDRLFIPGGLFTTEVQWRRSEVTDPLTGEERRISGQSPMRWEAEFTQDIARWNTTWGVDVADGGFEEVFYRLREVRRVEYDPYVNVFAEWKPRPNLALRFELQNILARERRVFREFFGGPRDASPLNGTEERTADYPTAFYFRIRRTL